ncbi:hypothetical protein DFQ04_3063 [Algoriphagus boseongensis]|uniref:Uncharacterized protein n=1 Tax=Algoriphagus boseongensis TaxID=1442587 RepID=A0A4R6T639_9BACT|nr:hypothetical protein [Algoriphagus boseongensis]TDQ15177.1 hypothetical protein DFQ04_3063 [Algoriphagus boseongensis]
MHTIWLIRSHEYSSEKFWEVLELLKTFQGPLQFKTQEKHLEIPQDRMEEISITDVDLKSQKLEPMTFYEKKLSSKDLHYSEEPWIHHKVSWETIFEQCQEYRIKEKISENDFIVLLTEHSNEYGWFTAGDPKGQRNLFVHTAFWEHYTGSDHRYPVAYHVASAVLKRLTFNNYSDLNAHLHIEARGCINDFCAEKKKVSLKLRTADICPACMDLMDKRNVDRSVIRQVLSIIEGIRDQMLFKSRWKLDPKPLKLQVKGESKRIIFPELGNLEVKFTPLEKTLFLLYLNHPEGIRLVELSDFRPELKRIYAGLYTGSDPTMVDANIESLSNPLSNSASEKLSRIKSKMIQALGADLAPFYFPKGENAEPRKIEVGRELVEYWG